MLVYFVQVSCHDSCRIMVLLCNYSFAISNLQVEFQLQLQRVISDIEEICACIFKAQIAFKTLLI